MWTYNTWREKATASSVKWCWCAGHYLGYSPLTKTRKTLMLSKEQHTTDSNRQSRYGCLCLQHKANEWNSIWMAFLYERNFLHGTIYHNYVQIATNLRFHTARFLSDWVVSFRPISTHFCLQIKILSSHLDVPPEAAWCMMCRQFCQMKLPCHATVPQEDWHFQWNLPADSLL